LLFREPREEACHCFCQSKVASAIRKLILNRIQLSTYTLLSLPKLRHAATEIL
jgi:hypothetical protein